MNKWAKIPKLEKFSALMFLFAVNTALFLFSSKIYGNKFIKLTTTINTCLDTTNFKIYIWVYSECKIDSIELTKNFCLPVYIMPYQSRYFF